MVGLPPDYVYCTSMVNPVDVGEMSSITQVNKRLLVFIDTEGS